MIHYDIGQDIVDPNSLIATEVFADQVALERQNAHPEVAAIMKLIEAGALSMAPEWTVYEVASAESPAI